MAVVCVDCFLYKSKAVATLSSYTQADGLGFLIAIDLLLFGRRLALNRGLKAMLTARPEAVLDSQSHSLLAQSTPASTGTTAQSFAGMPRPAPAAEAPGQTPE